MFQSGLLHHMLWLFFEFRLGSIHLQYHEHFGEGANPIMRSTRVRKSNSKFNSYIGKWRCELSELYDVYTDSYKSL